VLKQQEQSALNKNIVVVGACGFGKEVAWLAKSCGYQVLGFLDDDEQLHGSQVLGLPVLGDLSCCTEYFAAAFVVAIGNPRVRQALVGKIEALRPHVKWATLTHPNVLIDDSVLLGKGTVVTAGCTLTTDINIGDHCIVNINSTVGHDCVLADFVTVAPLVAISGNVTLGQCVEIGTSASIRQGVTVEEGAVLGMGGVLIKSQPANTVFVGNPAKELVRA
jgi:sugar O-acyltransferase (sialic acid O-acetyltransferase NeuD family)